MKSRKELRRIAVALETSQQTPHGRDTANEDRLASRRPPLLYRVRVLLFTSPAKSRRAIAARSSFPIMGFVGPNGGGKTACAVSLAQSAMASGRRVLSTVPLLDATTGELHALYVPWTEWDQLLSWCDGDVLADEIVSIAGARESASLDVRAQTLLLQLRKVNVRFWWTAPSFSRSDRIIREVTQAVTECRGFYADRRAAQSRRGVIQTWAPKRLFSFRTYDTVEFEEWTSGKRDKANPLVSEWFKGPGSAVFRGYDTLGSVNVISGVNDSGICDTCSGVVSGKPKPCRCRVPVIRPPVQLDPVVDQSTGEVLDALDHSDHELPLHVAAALGPAFVYGDVK
jgi:hypothetical protein